MWEKISEYAFSPLGYTAFGFILGALGRAIMKYGVSKLPAPAWVKDMIARLGEELKSVADDAYRAHTVAISRARVDGVVTPEELAGARQAALDAARAHLKWTAILGHLVKIATGAALDRWVEDKVAEAVKASEAAGDAAVAASPPKGAAAVVGEPEDVP